MAAKSGLRLPCGESGLSGVEMSTQQTKWCDPSAGKQCWVSLEVRSRVPQGAGGAGSAEEEGGAVARRRRRGRTSERALIVRSFVFEVDRFSFNKTREARFSLLSFSREQRRDSSGGCGMQIGTN